MICSILGFLALATPLAQAAPWMPDQGNGTYRNPVLYADYSDPDAVRVGNDFYLVASSFQAVPGLPILRSRDLVNWTLIGHALPRLPPETYFSAVHHGEGVWAPAIRYHHGRFVIYYPDPDRGIYRVDAAAPEGPWSEPVLVEAGRGLIDPCPFWDDDGSGYLVHGWAKSRAGIANLLTLQPLSADGRQVTGPGRTIIDANLITGWHTLEGPKMYKRHGYYYIFAPAGGVPTGYQAVFRSRSPWGPYDRQIVLQQGRTPINGPHQGAWVTTPGGEDWFLHFTDRGPYGRIVCLEPMAWRDDWPVMGAAVGGGGDEPVLTYRKPSLKTPVAAAEPATSDEFRGPALGLQWQWNADPGPNWATLRTDRPGLRLRALPAPTADSRYNAPNFLLQKFPAPAFTATTQVEVPPSGGGESIGLAVFGYDYAILQVSAGAVGGRVIELVVNRAANKGGREQRMAAAAITARQPLLRFNVSAGAVCQFSYSDDGVRFMPLGDAFNATVDRWVGARFGLIATTNLQSSRTAYATVNWLRVGR